MGRRAYATACLFGLVRSAGRAWQDCGKGIPEIHLSAQHLERTWMSRRIHPDVVNHIRRFHAKGYSITHIAEALGISRQAASDIVHYKTHPRVVDDGQPLRRLKPNLVPIRANGLPDPPAS